MGFTSKRELERQAEIAEKKRMNAKAIRARARRHGGALAKERDLLYKPLAEWDEEELARGRPRDSAGGWRGKTPDWVSRDVYEEAMKRFTSIIKTGMNGHTVKALAMLGDMIENDDTDDNGKPLVSAAAKVDIAKFLLEHVVGKPTQRTETDISVRLQGILGMAMVPAGELADSGIIDTELIEDDDQDLENDGD